MLKWWITLLLASVVIAQQSNQCNKRIMDETSARVTSFNDKYGRKFPETRSQMTEYCKGTKEDITWLANYNDKCQKDTTKQFTSILVFSIKNVLKNFCGKKVGKKRVDELLTMGKCANANKKEINKCVTKFIESEQGIIKAKAERRIPHICCEYYKTTQCIDNTIRPRCPKQADQIIDFLRNVFQSLVDAICGEYTESSDKCEKLPSPPKKTASEKPNESFVLPLVTIWDSLPKK